VAASPRPVTPEVPRHVPDDTFYRLVNAIQTDDSARQRTIQSLNKVLRSLSINGWEEPPIPDNATIRDMVTGSSQPVQQPAATEETQVTPYPPEPPTTLPEPLPEPSAELAAATLSVADDDTVPLDQLSLRAFMETVKTRGPGLVPLIADALRTVDEPSFVNQVLRSAPPASILELVASSAEPPATVEMPEVPAPSEAIAPPETGAPPEEVVAPEGVASAEPPATIPEVTAPPEIIAETEPPSLAEWLPQPSEVPAEPPALEQQPIEAVPPVTSVQPVEGGQLAEGIAPVEPAEPAGSVESGAIAPLLEPVVEDEVAALAVQLTQLTVNSTAQATLLTRGDKLIAAAGPLSTMPGVAEAIHRAWHSAADVGETLIRNLFLPDVGDILLYSTATLDGMRLSMLFPFDTPVKGMRKLAQNLTAALSSVPEAPAEGGTTSALPIEAEAGRTQPSRPPDLRPPEGLPEAIQAETVESTAPRAEGPNAGYGFVWLPGQGPLAAEITDSLITALNTITEAHRWTIEGTEIQPGYVSVQISIPANETATAAVETLMRETATRAGDENLWADGYYVVTPGRPISAQEIAQFVEYQRGAA